MRKLAFVVAMILAMVGMSAAQPADPGRDSCGIYFSEGAGDGSWCANATPGSTLTAYVCLTRGRDVSGYIFLEGRLEVSTGGTLTDFRVPGGGVNGATEPEFAVTWASPLAYDPSLSTVVVEMDLLVGWEFNIGLRLWPATTPSGAEQLPAIKTAGAPDTFVTLGYSHGWDEGTGVPNWQASVNDPGCPDAPSVPTDERSWGDVKALYR